MEVVGVDHQANPLKVMIGEHTHPIFMQIFVVVGSLFFFAVTINLTRAMENMAFHPD